MLQCLDNPLGTNSPAGRCQSNTVRNANRNPRAGKLQAMLRWWMMVMKLNGNIVGAALNRCFVQTYDRIQVNAR